MGGKGVVKQSVDNQHRQECLCYIPAFYPVVDAGLLARRGMPARVAAEALLEAGARILQFRHKVFFSREAFEDARLLAELCRNAGALFVVNDRADIAMLLNAALHLGQDDLAPEDARKLMPPPSIIGFSTHNELQLRDADREPVDYIAIGPIFKTASKENPDPIVGVERLRSLRAVTKKPLVAIGGNTRETASSFVQAGTNSATVIPDPFPQRCTIATIRSP